MLAKMDENGFMAIMVHSENNFQKEAAICLES